MARKTSSKPADSHGGRLGDISIYGQESNASTGRLAAVNLANRSIGANSSPAPLAR
jgi:type I restriction enzyme M protein